jgi:hypothetical protein
MMFLRITAPDGTRTYVPDNYTLQITTTADSTDAGSNYRAPNVVRGRINGVKYYDGANATAGAIVAVAAIPAYASGGTKYEYGSISVDGSFSVWLSN